MLPWDGGDSSLGAAGTPGALPSLGGDFLSPKPFPALPEKGLSGVRRAIWGFLAVSVVPG